MALLGMEYEDGVETQTLSNDVKYRKKGNIVTVYRPYGSSTISESDNRWRTLATLPTGYRPNESIITVSADNSASSSSNVPLETLIGTDGNVKYYVFSAGTYNPQFSVTYIV